MGNIFSSEEKLLRHRSGEIISGRNPRKGPRLYEQHRYHQSSIFHERQHENKYKKKRNVSFHGRYSKNDYIKPKSHSLNAILEELYAFGSERSFQNKEAINFEGGSLIPRIKLRRSTSSLKDERRYNALYKMSSDSEILIDENSTNSSSSTKLKKENNDIRTNMSESNITILLNHEIYDEISNKSEENYFAKNFDDCMKRLQLIEKEHHLMEKTDTDLQFCTVQKEDNIQKDNEEVHQILQTNEIQTYKTVCEYKNIENDSGENNNFDSEIKLASESHSSSPRENIPTAESKENGELDKESNGPKSPTNWYSNIKNQFEKKEQENQEQKVRETSCRITGATLKNQSEKSKSDDHEKNTRHYFSRLVKTNKTLIDEELPDPDKVKNIRTMFQEHLNSTLKRKLDKKLGGSLQNINCRAPEQQLSRPLSVQCYRNDLFCETQNQKSYEENDKKTSIKEISRPLRDIKGEFQIDQAKKKLSEKPEKDFKPGKEYKTRRVLQPKWTDTGSVSSGISSDLSSYDTDLESYSREGTEQDEMIISDDDLLEEVKDKHYVQNEVLEKIRSFGTSVTYYGGEMITCSVGPLLSPTTQAIIEEISEKYGDETSRARSFDEFYRKYVESNEPNRKKKLGRTRSFGQTDVFQKPNVLNNTEIEMYKNDLEIEIGIKKPVGFPQGSLKKKVTKPTSLESEKKAAEKETDSLESAAMTSEFIFLNDEGKQTSDEKDSSNNNEPVIRKESTDAKLTCETNLTSEIENNTITPESQKTLNETVRKEEFQKPASERDRLYLRSESAPEGLLNNKKSKNESDVLKTCEEFPAKEIYFSYEKSAFNGKRKPDMEFEEFEVCETLTEKLEKLEKINSTDKITESQENLSIASPKEEFQKTSEKSTMKGEDKADVNLTEVPIKEEKHENEIQKMLTQDEETTTSENNTNNTNEKRDDKFNFSRWPIETSVMVDIQKNNEQTPKIITNAKTVAKTKIRLF